MPRTRTRQQEVIDKIKGTIAEELFIQLHTDVGCLVFRSGTEFLYPNLYLTSQLKKNLFREGRMEQHIDAAAETIASLLQETSAQEFREDKKFRTKIRSEHFYPKPLDREIYSTPDFTIITRAGLVAQIEVKYRTTGILDQNELDKYLQFHPYAILFIFTEQEPYINIYVPCDGKRISVAASKEQKDADARRIELIHEIDNLGDYSIEKLEEVHQLDKKLSDAVYEPKREYAKNFLVHSRRNIAELRAKDVTDDEIPISVRLPDFSVDADLAEINTISYPLSTLKRCAEILNAIKGPLDELYKKSPT